MIVKYTGIIIDHKNRRIIHGEWNAVAKIENFTGLTAVQYKTSHGYLTELEKTCENFEWLGYTSVSAEQVWLHMLPLYEARLAELRKKGIHIDRWGC